MCLYVYYVNNIHSLKNKYLHSNKNQYNFAVQTKNNSGLFKVWGFGLHAVAPCVSSLTLIE